MKHKLMTFKVLILSASLFISELVQASVTFGV